MKKLKPEIKKIWDNLHGRKADADFVKYEFDRRGLSLSDEIQTVHYRLNGLVHIHGHLSTESDTAEIAIMKMLIKNDIVDNPDNYEDELINL